MSQDRVPHCPNRNVCHVEILTPKQSSDRLEEDLAQFGANYRAVVDHGCVVCIPDNPMGVARFRATEMISELGLEVKPDQLMLHLNTCHTKPDLDQILQAARKMGVRHLLTVSGDGSPRLPKLSPESLGFTTHSTTSVELLQYVRREHGDAFRYGVAFNPYEPQDHELEKMGRKVAAGAQFIVTQPIVGENPRLRGLKPFGLPVVVGAWMSKNLALLSQCVGYEISPDPPYDPIANLMALREHYPEWCVYLSLVRFKSQLPELRKLLSDGDKHKKVG